MKKPSLIKRFDQHPTVTQVIGYVRSGFPVIPIAPAKKGRSDTGKAPVVGFSPKDPINDEKKALHCWGYVPSRGVAIPTGRTSGLAVLDIDPRHDGDASLAELEREFGSLPSTVESCTGGGGRHFFFAYPPEGLKTRVSLRPGIDLKGDGGYVVVPPSHHHSGGVYQWTDGRELGEGDLAPVPAWLVDLAADQSVRAPSASTKTPSALFAAARNYAAKWNVAQEGQRNEVAFRLSGHLAAHVTESSGERLSKADILALVGEWNDRNSTPLEEAELSAAVHSGIENGTPREPHVVAENPDSGKEGAGVVDRLIALAADADLFLGYNDGSEVSCASVDVDGCRHTYRITDLGFVEWLQHKYWARYTRAAKEAALKDALHTLSAKARFDGERHPIAVRVGGLDGVVHLDLGNQAWETIEVSEGGWRVVSDAPVRFRRPNGLLPLPKPVHPGNVKPFRELVNLSGDDEWALLLGWLVAALRPTGPYPVLVVQGEQGSGKSTASRLIRRLIDPSRADLRAEPESTRDMMIAANNSWIIAFDNLSTISLKFSDAMCRVATGASYTARTLYSNDEETILYAERPILINGIDDLMTRPDLLDRAVILRLPSIPDEARRTEAEIEERFVRDHPVILGGLLSALAYGLRRLHEVGVTPSGRMVDFLNLGVAAERALHLPPGSFKRAYKRARGDINAVALDLSPVATAIIGLVERRGEWEGTAAQLLEELTDHPSNRLAAKRQGWPRTPNWLSNHLVRLSANLRSAGIIIERYRTSEARVIRIERG